MELIDIIKLKEKAIAIPQTTAWCTVISLIAIGLGSAGVALDKPLCRRLHFFPTYLRELSGEKARVASSGRHSKDPGQGSGARNPQDDNGNVVRAAKFECRVNQFRARLGRGFLKRDAGELRLTHNAPQSVGAENQNVDRKSTRLNSSHLKLSRMPSSA